MNPARPQLGRNRLSFAYHKVQRYKTTHDKILENQGSYVKATHRKQKRKQKGNENRGVTC